MGKHLDQAHVIASKWRDRDIREEDVLFFLLNLRLHFEEVAEKPSPVLKTYLDWVLHTGLDDAQHARLLGFVGSRLSMLHVKKGITARHPAYGTLFAEIVLGMQDLLFDLVELFKNHANIPFLNPENVTIFKAVVARMMIFLDKKELRGGETLFTKTGNLHEGNVRKFWRKSSGDYLYSLMYSIRDADRPEYPMRLTCEWALYRICRARPIEGLTNILPLDEDRQVIWKNFDRRPINAPHEPFPNNPGDFPNVTFLGQVLPPSRYDL